MDVPEWEMAWSWLAFLLVRSSDWVSAGLFSKPAACPVADADMLPSAGAAPAAMLITPVQEQR